MKANKPIAALMLTLGTMAISAAHPYGVSAQTAAAQSSSESSASSLAQWSVQIDKVDAGDINLAPSFQVAIYESLVGELSKTKRFKEVFRDRDRRASDVPDLLILKTTVESYTAGSETRRAVTTVSGATKLTVRSQLFTRDGKMILEQTVNGNVRFIGSNLRATYNLARNVAKNIRRSRLPEPSRSTERTQKGLVLPGHDLWPRQLG